jgi:hypothetical protein
LLKSAGFGVEGTDAFASDLDLPDSLLDFDAALDLAGAFLAAVAIKSLPVGVSWRTCREIAPPHR